MYSREIKRYVCRGVGRRETNCCVHLASATDKDCALSYLMQRCTTIDLGTVQSLEVMFTSHPLDRIAFPEEPLQSRNIENKTSSSHAIAQSKKEKRLWN